MDSNARDRLIMGNYTGVIRDRMTMAEFRRELENNVEDDENYNSDDGLIVTWIDGPTAANNVYVSLKKEAIKGKLVMLTDNAADELYEMGYSGSPLWKSEEFLGAETLDREVYRNRFMANNKRRKDLVVEILRGSLDDPTEIPSLMQPPTRPKAVEASWARETVLKHPIQIVNMFMNVEKWLATFASIVSGASVIFEDGSLIAMKVEYGLPTPNPTQREAFFVRRLRKMTERIWSIVDASLDITCLKYHKKPSGCLIEEMDDGFSRVTWVEHNERSTNAYLHELFRENISSGFAFCASRWITALKHEADNQFVINQHINARGGGMSSLLRLAHRMSQTCIRNMNVSPRKNWSFIDKMDNAEPLYLNWDFYHNNLGRPDGLVVMMASSVKSSFTVDHIFDALRCAECRSKWDIVVGGGFVRKDLHLPIGNDPSFGISVLHVEVPEAEKMKCLQVCFTDSIAMYVVWTFLPNETLYAIIEGADPDFVPILVFGAAILPKNPEAVNEGSILTFSGEIQDVYGGRLTIESLNDYMTTTISSINALCAQPPGDDGFRHEDEEYLRLFNNRHK